MLLLHALPLRRVCWGVSPGYITILRGAWGTEGFTINQMAGTDEHLMGGSAQNPRVFTYNGITRK